MDIVKSILMIVMALVLCPLLPGVINRVKAFFAGRRGVPLLQLYYDLFKLLRKGAVYSRTTSWLIKAGPLVGMACTLVGAAIVPLGGQGALLSFDGDLILLAYLFGLMRFFTVLAALDTASPFEGMGASREVTFSMLAEPALLVGLAAMARFTTHLPKVTGWSLSDIYSAISPSALTQGAGAALLLVAGALLVVFLTENARIPVDDPNTHLELTMIHEAMVLDHCGVDFAFIQYSASLKLWLLGELVVGVLLPIRSGMWAADIAIGVAGLVGLAAAVGVIESTLARLRLVRVPQLLVGATVLSVLAAILVTR